jgi:serine/threonine protein kinase/tetratricopeptide (TPR) repeat protein
MWASGAQLSGVIANRYRIERQIGEGGMATVYLAWDQNRDVHVALKAPKPELVAQLGAERFAREVQITTKLQHPHIVPVLDSGFAADGVPFFIMPFIDGETLGQRLRRTGPLPVDEAIQLTSEVLDGLAYAHSMGFVHRDVKPSNVMLLHGHALLADFGIARAVEKSDARRLTESGFALGTAEYMSPEQAAGEQHVDGRSDLYSVACVLYEMLVGGPPFTAPTARAVMARHFVDPVPSIRTVRDTVPVKLEMAVTTALAKMPVDRFADATSFKAALRDPTLRDQPAAVRPRAAANTRGRLLGIAGAALTLAAAGAVFWRSRSPAEAALELNRVMVFPFVVPSTMAAASTMGEDVATIIGTALDGADPLRWIDGWSLLDKDARANIRTLTNDVARRLAKQKRCATYVTGRLVSTGDSVRVFLTLYDVQGDSVLAQSEANGDAKEPWRQGLSAVSGVLPRLIPGAGGAVSPDWKDRNPGAVAQFLLGESRFRRAQMPEALNHYRRAIALDSTFTFAALRGAQAASWNHHTDEAAAMVNVALSRPLPARYQQLAMGIGEYVRGRADSSAAHLTAALKLDPEMTLAWVQLGEVYTHLLPLRGNPDALADSAFARARQLDTASVSVLFHPIEMRLLRGDVAGAAPLLARFRAAKPDSTLLTPLEIMEECVSGGAGTVAWTARIAAAPLAVLSAGRALAAAGAHPACADSAFQSVLTRDTAITDAADGRRFSAMLGLQALQVARGTPQRAAATIDAYVARWGAGASVFLLDGALVPELRDRARRVARADSVQYPGYTQMPYSLRLWELGMLELRSGNLNVAASVTAELQRRAAATDSAYVRARAQSLAAYVTLARGDTAGAERAFTDLLTTTPHVENDAWDETAPLAAERLTLAQLLHARGAHEDAIAVASVLDGRFHLIHVLYLAPSLDLRAQAARAMGNTELQSRYLARLTTLRRGATATGG